jgi:hypothetical protein
MLLPLYNSHLRRRLKGIENLNGERGEDLIYHELIVYELVLDQA